MSAAQHTHRLKQQVVYGGQLVRPCFDGCCDVLKQQHLFSNRACEEAQQCRCSRSAGFVSRPVLTLISLWYCCHAHRATSCCVQSLPTHIDASFAVVHTHHTSCRAGVSHPLTHEGLGNKVHAWQCLHQAGVLLVQRVPAHAQHYELRGGGPCTARHDLRQSQLVLAWARAGVLFPWLPEVICHDACVAHDAVGLLLRNCCCGLLLLAVCGTAAAGVQLLCAARRLRHRLLLHAVAACMCSGHPRTASQRVGTCCWGQRQPVRPSACLWLWSG